MHVDYVDIFYHHRPDPDTPIEETMQALYDIVKSGKALYVGISNYNADQAAVAIRTLKEMGMHMLIHQPNYSMMNRWIENGLTDVLTEEGVGCIAFGPLAGGVLAGRYLNGFAADSRAIHDPRFLRPDSVTEKKMEIVRKLNDLAQKRGQTLAQMALAWTLRSDAVTSALIGASKPEQILENVKALDNAKFTAEELAEIDAILA
jgi:L-glyceraldehyde 3-phosphate reductase